MGHPIYVVSDRPRNGYFYLSNDLVRVGAHRSQLDADGFLVMAYLLSHAGGKGRPFETSPARISAAFGWSRNRLRADRALANAEKNHRLVIRKFWRDGKEVPKRRAYVVAAGGRKFTDWELAEYGKHIILPSKKPPKSAS